MTLAYSPIIKWLRRPAVAIPVTVIIILLIATLDQLTSPSLDFSIAYFIPITYAAWSLGQIAALIAALIAEIPTYRDQLYLAKIGEQPLLISTLNIFLRLLVYLFVANVAYRLTKRGIDIQNAYSSLDEDLRTAGLLQASMLLPESITLNKCEVGSSIRYAGRTGGDFVDIGVLDGHIYACIADVSGSGTPAALFTALLKHLLQDALRHGLRGGSVINAMNLSLCRVLPIERFVTLAYVEMDPETGHGIYINAGHPEGVVYRTNTWEFELLTSTAPILGYCSIPSHLAESELLLNNNDILVLYSDGATESKTLDGGRLGDEPIRQLTIQYAHLPAQSMADAIISDIEAMTIPGKRDDIAVVCIKMGHPTEIQEPS